MIFAILAEDDSDRDSLKTLVRRIAENPSLTVLGKGFGGCGALQKNVCRFIDLFRSKGATHFVICRDADGPHAKPRYDELCNTLSGSITNEDAACIVIPVQEIEAWLIADPMAISSTIKSLRIKEVPHPEHISKPKAWLVRQAQRLSKPKYAPRTHNPRIAEYLNINQVLNKCPSFQPLVDFVRNSTDL